MLAGKRILLVIGGGIAAYKALDLIRRLRERGAGVRCILTEAAQQFVTPLAAAALSGERAHTDLFDRDDEAEIGHIRARPRGRPRRRRAGHRQPHGAHGGRPRRRSRLDGAARHPPADPDRARP